MEATPDFSIVVPVYNVERYVERCLDSIYHQKFAGTIEVIAVDDCSTDNSLQILKKYQRQQSNLRILEHSENQKLSVARDTGIKAARGRYVLNVDSDDWILPETLAILKQAFDKSHADVLVFNSYREKSNGQRQIVSAFSDTPATTDKFACISLFMGACWNKAVRRELLLNLTYGSRSINSGEDLLYGIEILLKAETIQLISAYCYVYFVNSSSLTATVTVEEFTGRMLLLLMEVNKVFQRYMAPPEVRDYVMNYMEKCLDESFAKMHMQPRHENITAIHETFRGFEELGMFHPAQISSLRRSLSKKTYAYRRVYHHYGWKHLARLWLRMKRKR